MPPHTISAHGNLIGCRRRDKSGWRLKLFHAAPIRNSMATEVSQNQAQRTVAAECLTAKVLVLDDDANFRALARAILEPDGFEVIEAEAVRQCLAQLRNQAVDAVILDMVMPERDGLEALRELKDLFPEIRIVAVSGAAESELYLTVSAHLGADASLPKSNIGALGPLLHVVLDR
jgi:CheY-like chemotaxis protein